MDPKTGQCCQSEVHTKIINIYLNGVRKFTPRKVVLDSKKGRSWFRVLDEITRILESKIITRRLFTAESGTSIHSFTDLDNYENYVASDNKDYIKLERGYLDQKYKVNYLNPYSNCALWLQNLRKNLTHIRPDLLIIYVLRNNKPCERPKKIVLTQNDLTKWHKTIEYIARQLDLRKEVIRFFSLYTTNGHRICGPWELQHGATYVAVGYDEKFTPGQYPEAICASTKKWRFGVPYYYKPKTELCYHEKQKRSYSTWEQNINWKNFNQRYADIIDDCFTCRQKIPCRPQCDCQVHKYSIPCTSYWSRNAVSQTESSDNLNYDAPESKSKITITSSQDIPTNMYVRYHFCRNTKDRLKNVKSLAI